MATLKRYQIVLFFLLLGITFLLFLNSINSRYAFLDDAVMLRSEKRHALKDLSVKNVINTFKYSHEGLYHPIVTISYTVEKALFGFTPELFHFDNVILHLINVTLVFLIFFAITKSFWLSFVVMALFAVHPTRVEVVAWITARKDLLYSVFYLSAMLFYVKTYTSDKTKRLMLLSAVCFILACFSKPMAITLPFVLLLLDFYTGNLSGKRIKFYFVYLIVSVIFIITAVNIHYSDDFIKYNFTIFYHFINFINAHFHILFYFDKLILPIKLYCMYPLFYNLKTMPPYYILYSPAVLYIIIYFVFLSLRRTKLFFFGFMFFFITILPASSILHIGDFVVADRYTYVPYLGLFFIISNLIKHVYIKVKDKKNIKTLFISVCLIIFVTFCGLSYRRTIDWQNNEYEPPYKMKYYYFGFSPKKQSKKKLNITYTKTTSTKTTSI